MMPSRKYPRVSGAICGMVFSGLGLVAVFGGITCTAVAGDLLRGGYTQSQSGGAPGSFTPPSVIEARQNARDVLARTTRAIQAVSAMESTARKLAISGANDLGINPNDPGQTLPIVQNGLNMNGLVPDSGLSSGGVANQVTTWQNANTPTQAAGANGQTVVTVVQTGADAVLNWSSFNISKSTTLAFNQSKAGADVNNWIAFNIVNDPTAVPSQILGSISAPGQVYVINQNGIIFGGSSQVNVHTLVASSLPIDTYLIGRGLLNNPDDQFLFSALSQPEGKNGSPTFTPPDSYLTNNVDGAVTVQAGAEITVPASVDHVGGRVALIGPVVTNDGAISTPDGQTILAAGLQVGLAAHSSSDPSLRGLDVYIGAVIDPNSMAAPYAGVATNNGYITAPEGDITIAGEMVDQLGVVDSTTSVTLNGRIDLLANYNSLSSGGVIAAPFLQQSTGIITLGADSVTQILPELSSDQMVVGSQLALSSEVNMQGLAIHLEKDATLYAPDATVNLDAGVWEYRLNGRIPQTSFVYNGGQIYVDSGAAIDVAGSEDVPASVADNIITVQLRGAELADSPLERSSALEGQNLQIDISQTGVYDGQAWVGTPLGDAFGYLNLIERTVGELTANGGTVNLDAGGSVVTQAGSTIDVSGGWIDYQGAVVQTTRLLSNGLVYDIADAYPNIDYSGIYLGTFTVDHSKYGITDTYTSPLALTGAHYEQGYFEGGNGGALNITAPSVALDGNLLGRTVAGLHQLSLPPAPGSLSLSFEAQSLALLSEYSFPYVDPTPPAVILGGVNTLPPVGPFALDSSGNPLALPAARQAEVVLSPDIINSDGFSILDINDGDGSVTVPAGVTLRAQANPASSITVSAANLNIGGAISAPGGSMTFTVYDSSPLPLQPLDGTPPVDPTRGNFTLDPGASLNTAGLIVDNREGIATALTMPQVYSGGSITIKSYNVDLAAGSSLDVSGGVEAGASGAPTYGNAGAIAVEGGQDPGVASLIGGKLVLDATLTGYSGNIGGSLTILAPLVQVGGETANPNTLLLSPGFFSLGGFASYTVEGLGEAAANGQFLPAVLIAPDTILRPVDESLVVGPGGGGGIALIPYLEPEGVRAPVSLAFAAPGVMDTFPDVSNPLVIRGDIVMGSGAVIQTDALGSVTFSGQTVAIEGTVDAPGGSIAISGASVFPGITVTSALPTVDLGPRSILSVAGATVLTANAEGYRTGFVLPGGTITVKGNIVGESGALLDVSGASDVLDLAPSYSNFLATPGEETVGATATTTAALDSFLGSVLIPTQVDTSGGSIVLAGGQELYMDATLLGDAGGPAAYGGTLSVSSGRTDTGGTQLPTEVTLTVTQSGKTILNPNFHPKGTTAIGYAVDSTAGMGGGYFSVSSFVAGGFDSLALNPTAALGAVDFSGPVSITARQSLDVAGGGVLVAGGAVDLSAPYVILGIPFAPPLQTAQQPVAVFTLPSTGEFYFLPANGAGSLTVNASLIDVGTISFQNIGNVSLIAKNGDIRGEGTLDIAGNLLMQAGQVYTPTDSIFTIADYDYTTGAGANMVTNQGMVTFAGGGIRPLPLSAGGEINVYASVINQGGVLRAPLGIINLGANPGAGVTPFDPLTGAGTGQANAAVASVDPTQTLTLSAGSVTSVSQIDPITGQPVVIPYGVNLNGTTWIDPTNSDITSSGPPAKAINISAQNVNDLPGALIDVRGGGDLLSYQFVPGIGGNVDLLGSPSGAWNDAQQYAPGDLVSYKGATYSALSASLGVSPSIGQYWDLVPQEYAIIPGYQAAYSPYAPYNASPLTGNNDGTDAGYVSAGAAGRPLSVGDQVYLGAGGAVSAGVYTLLPARYALLPGAFLVTPESGAPVGAELLPDGSSLVSGYRFDGLNAPSARPLLSSFDVASQSVVNTLAQYDLLFANSFFATGGSALGTPAARVPMDAGHVVLQATLTMSIQGAFASQAAGGGLGAIVDISSPANILIAGAGVTGGTGELVLNSSELSAIGAESLLIGGVRQTGPDGDTVTVATDSIEVDNSGSPLTGSDIILASNLNLTLDSGAQINSAGQASGLSPVLVNGDGALIRISSDPAAMVARSDVTAAAQPLLSIGANAKLSGASVTLDSSDGMSIDPTVSIKATALALNSGQIAIALTNPGVISQSSGLILSGNALGALQGGVQSLSLLSYSSIDLYGTGQIGAVGQDGQPSLQTLALHAAEIRGFNNNGGQVTFEAQDITLDNSPGGSGPGPVSGNTPDGTLAFDGGVIHIGSNQLAVDQFANLELNASGSVVAQGAGGLTAQNDLTITAPFVTGAGGSDQTIAACGAFIINAPAGTSAGPGTPGGFGASLTLVGASMAENSTILLPSGSLTLHAVSGDLSVSGKLDATGEARAFFDLTEYTNGGQITLMADNGNANLAAGSDVTVAAASGGGNAGTLSIIVPNGQFNLEGSISGQGGTLGSGGTFSLDAGSLPVDSKGLQSLAALGSALDAASFSQSVSVRVRTGDVLVNGLITTHAFNLSTDGGSIDVTGRIDASGATGGAIDLAAAGSVTLSPGAVLTVAGQDFDAAGKGGAVSLEAGSDINGAASGSAVVDIQTGSTIDLAVANASPAPGDVSGTLLIRAPQTAGNTDLQVNPINGVINGASSITLEGYEIYNTASDNGSIDDQEVNVYSNGQTFAGNTQAIASRLFAANPNGSAYSAISIIEPGAEIINPSGDLTLANTWDLSYFRFGPDNVPGILTLRAAGNLVFEFDASLSDGFDAALAPDGSLWDAPLSPGVGVHSWSYNLIAGADFTAADSLQVVSNLPSGAGSLLLGEGSEPLPTDIETLRDNVVPNYFQTIRTGDGNIQIAAAEDVQLLNQLATIYTAGTLAPAVANFDIPAPYNENGTPNPAQYSMDGGNVFIQAGHDIVHYAYDLNGNIVPYSSLELPNNWLYRQGFVDPLTGQFGAAQPGGAVESTSWWVDFSNFYEGVGALGGGNVTLIAGNNVTNVDAAIPTNALMPKGAPSEAGLVELGGGNLVVQAGNNIDGGVYYVERGHGTLTAGGQILTNSTRAALSETVINNDANSRSVPDPSTWLPTTLFAGDSSFDITAGGNILLGPVANVFLLPQGTNNSYLNKSYFSTYAAGDEIDVSSLNGSVTLRDNPDLGASSLETWLTNVDLYSDGGNSFASQSQPWLAVVETSLNPFATLTSIMPPALRATAFSGDINLDGTLLLAPSPVGTVDLAAAGSINGVQPNSFSQFGNLDIWGSSEIDLSDADPSLIPAPDNPLSFSEPSNLTNWVNTDPTVFSSLIARFAESGSTEGSYGTVQTQQALHTRGILHATDPNPVHLYATGGSISGLTLFSGKAARVLAGEDITDVAFYIQNDNASDVSVIAAAGDITLFDLNSPLRQMAVSAGNELLGFSLDDTEPASSSPTAGDIQISGPGTLEVLAGQNLNTGNGPNNVVNGTAVGITSIGNARDPYLPFGGANIVASAGIDATEILSSPDLDINAFTSEFLASSLGSRYFADLAATDPELDIASYEQFSQLGVAQQDLVALDLFFLVLRDAGRDHNLAGSPGFGKYTEGLAAIRALFPSTVGQGNITLSGREIKTENGGNIDLLAPYGSITVGIELPGTQTVDQGVFTQDGGNINMYTEGDVNVGTSRVFTLRGGNEIIWSSEGNIDAGASSKTVQSAPPTRVLVDPQSGNVETDLAGLATGGGIGVLDAVAGVPPGSVDLIAPTGTINAGDAGIRATGNLNLAAVQVLNASNIQAGGASSGVPTVTVAAPNLGAIAASSAAAGAGADAARDQTNNQTQSQSDQSGDASIINVEVVGYGGGDDDSGSQGG